MIARFVFHFDTVVSRRQATTLRPRSLVFSTLPCRHLSPRGSSSHDNSRPALAHGWLTRSIPETVVSEMTVTERSKDLAGAFTTRVRNHRLGTADDALCWTPGQRGRDGASPLGEWRGRWRSALTSRRARVAPTVPDAVEVLILAGWKELDAGQIADAIPAQGTQAGRHSR